MIISAFTVSSQTKDIMSIRLKDSTIQSFAVEDVEEVFFETKDSPELPPAPTTGANVISINDNKFTYDALGRLISFIDEDGRHWRMDYNSYKLNYNGYNVGEFKLDSQNRISELKMESGYYTETAVFEYNSDNQLIKWSDTSYDKSDGWTEVHEAHLNWQDGLITSFLFILGNEEFNHEFTYTDYKNNTNQWTKAMGGDNATGEISISHAFSISGMMGMAPLKFPETVTSALISKTRAAKPTYISYTFNSDGSVSEEKIGSSSFVYTYGDSEKEHNLRDKTRCSLFRKR